MTDCIDKAIEIAIRYGGIEGDHHKAWVIDQMLRALTNCPLVWQSGISADGKSYDYQVQGESQDYKALISDACEGGEYDWDTGVAP